MIEGTSGLLLHLWLVVGLSVLAAALFMVIIQSRLLASLGCFNVAAKQRFLWCIALFPYAVGLYAASLVLTPTLFHHLGLALDHGHLHYPHGHFHWLSWQGAGVLLLAIAACWKLLAMLWRRSRQQHHLQTLLAFSDIDPKGCYRVESDIPNAFTLGLLNPKILISRALDRALTADELDIVYRHELAHQRTRDPLRWWRLECITPIACITASKPFCITTFNLPAPESFTMVIFPALTHLKPIWNRFFAPKSMLLLLLIAPLVNAGERANTAKPLGLQQAVTKTLEQNPTLVAFGHQFEAQAGRIQQAGLKPNPELTLAVEDAFGSGELTGMDSAETTLGISWVLEGQQRHERVNAAQARTSVLEVERDIKRLDAAANSARLYMLTLALQTRLQQAGQAIDFARNVVKVIDQRVNAGNSPTAERARAKVELSRRLLEHEDIEHELLVAKRQLAAQWGSTEVEFTAVEGTLTQLPKVASYSELKSRLDQNPRLQYFVTSERWEESQLALAKAQSKPQWRLSAGVKHLSATDDQALVAGIAVPLGVFDLQQGRITEARALMALNRAEREAEQIQLDTALYGTHQELLHSLHIVNTYQTEILPALDIALKETRRAYDLGRYSYLEWQAVQRDYLDAQSTLIEASLATHLKAIELERLTGVAIAPASVNSTTNQQ